MIGFLIEADMGMKNHPGHGNTPKLSARGNLDELAATQILEVKDEGGMVTGDSENPGRITGGETSQVGGKGSARQGGRLPDGSSSPGDAQNADRVLP